MSSKILVDELAGKTAAGNITVTSEGGSATMQLQQGLAKAWINFNGTGTITTRDSLNISSITDDGTGDYITTVTSAFNNNDYSIVGNAAPNYASGWALNLQIMHRDGNQEQDNSTTTQQFQTTDANTILYDPIYITHNLHGDLA